LSFGWHKTKHFGCGSCAITGRAKHKTQTTILMIFTGGPLCPSEHKAPAHSIVGKLFGIVPHPADSRTVQIGEARHSRPPEPWCRRVRIVSGARHVLLSQEDSVIETQSRSRERRFQSRIPTSFGSGTSPRATLRAALPS
jgi:hypothetical protein